jgi:CRP-like cAMP-binding protein
MKLYLTRQILEECLETLDIFKEILEDPVQKSKLIRDVNKNLQLKLYDEGAIIYNKGETSSSFYMVIKGQVSLCMPVFKGESSGYQSDAFGKSHDFDEQ